MEVIPALQPGRRFGAPVRLTSAHDLRAFSSRSPELNTWLKTRALSAEKRRSARTYVVADDSDIVVAYYALAAGSVSRDDVPRQQQRNMPDTVPAVVIGRFAVDAQLEAQGFGRSLVVDALRRIALSAETIGIKVVIVHALDGGAARFWAHFGFIEWPLNSQHLYLPVDTAVKLIMPPANAP